MVDISVIFTCRGRPELTELCLRRFKEIMPKPYELIIVYDGRDVFYEKMLLDVGNPAFIIDNLSGRNRWYLLNDALSCASGPYFMHLENDFWWNDPTCLGSALAAFEEFPDSIDFIRFEILPFTANQFTKSIPVKGHDICWMKPTTPFRWNLNPHIRKFKFPGGHLLKTDGFSKQPEQHHADEYKGISCCVTGDNFRHLGIYDESGFPKLNYLERFFNKRYHEMGFVDTKVITEEFNRLTDNLLYQKLFLEYMKENE